MTRTQVYLEENQIQEIALLAKRQKQDKAKIIRNLIQKGLEIEKKKQSVGEALLKLAALGKELKLKGPKDLSINHDTYLYRK